MSARFISPGLNARRKVALSATGFRISSPTRFTDPALAGYNVGFAIETIVPNQTVLITEDLANDIGGTVATWEDLRNHAAAYRIVAAAKATAASGLPGATIIDRSRVFVSKSFRFIKCPCCATPFSTPITWNSTPDSGLTSAGGFIPIKTTT
jgi:hypothetical protein